MKTLKRDQLIKAIEKRYGENTHVRPSEEFNGSGGGIWMAGDNGDLTEKDSFPVFNYYDDSTRYDFGVHKRFAKWLETRGWHCEWYDAGTISIWES